VDLDARLVEVWTPRGERPAVVDDRLVWQPDPAAAAASGLGTWGQFH
jgi:hypothetical protein